MNAERLFSFRNPWFGTALCTVAAITLAAGLTGFLWLPSWQPDARFDGIWNAICAAAGLVRDAPAGRVVTSDTRTSVVVMTPQMLRAPSAISIGDGATLSLQCTMCHGARGLSEADVPNLAGQYALVIFKQLQDYASGARSSAIMSPRVLSLSEQDMRDIAAYYDYLPRLPGTHPSPEGRIPVIVASGAPMRNIAPCATCHGGVDHQAGSPWLDGESPVYLRAQLEAFASGTRHNDISQQMRNIARNMTPAEIEESAAYYGSPP